MARVRVDCEDTRISQMLRDAGFLVDVGDEGGGYGVVVVDRVDRVADARSAGARVLLVGDAAGADDFVTPPVSPQELARRVKRLFAGRPASIRVMSGVVDLDKGLIRRDEGEVRLTGKEIALLRYLSERPGITVSRGELLQRVWGYNPSVRSRTDQVAVTRLRAKLELDPSNPDHLLTVYGVGYCFEPLEETEAEVSLVADGTTRFIGRTGLLDHLVKAVERPGLVTLRGPGGVGKTRLARQLAAQLDGVFVDLRAAETADDVVRRVAATLHMAPSDELDLERVGRKASRHLIVLDNLEHLDLVELLSVWTQQGRWVGTSRRPVGVGSEQIVEVPPLPEDDALALFVDRARRVRWEFSPSAAEERKLRPFLMQRLDGLPLAIELAASRLTVLSVDSLVARIDERFALLRREGEPDPRHQTLFATIAWSWELLDDASRQALRRCAVFVDGFDLAAAAHVLELERSAALDAIQLLRDASLLTWDGRFGMLESIREFALQQGADMRIEALHAGWFAEAAATVPAADEGNLRAARAWLLANDEVDDAAACTLGIDRILRSRGPHRQRIGLLSEVIDAAGEGPRSRLLRARGVAWMDMGDFGQSEVDLRAAAETAPRAGALADLAAALHRGADQQALAEVVSAATSAARKEGDADAEAQAWLYRGHLMHIRYDLQSAEESFSTALAGFRAVGNRAMEGAALGNLAILYEDQGRPADRLRAIEAALALAREVGDDLLAFRNLSNLANTRINEGKPDEAIPLFDEAWRLAVALDSDELQLETLARMSVPALDLGRFEEVDAMLDEVRADLGHVDMHMRFIVMLIECVLRRFQGRHAEALEVARSVHALAVEVGHDDHRAYSRFQQACILADMGRVDEAEAAADEAWGVWHPEDPVGEQLVAVARAHLARTRQLPHELGALREAEHMEVRRALRLFDGQS